MIDQVAKPPDIEKSSEERVRFLLDTQAFLWLAAGDDRISPRVLDIFDNPKVDFFLSVASVWEIAIKKSLGRLELGLPLGQFLRRQLKALRTQLLEVSVEHALAVETLPFHHRDPFDRLLIAQAMLENLTLLSSDSHFDRYLVDRAW